MLATQSTQGRTRRAARLAVIAGSTLCALASPLAAFADTAPPISGDYVDRYTPSPAYLSDHELYAVGQSAAGGCSGSCEWVYHSGNGGASWSAVPMPSGWFPGQVVLPSAYPADPTIFLSGADSTSKPNLLRSGDGGATWTDTGTYESTASVAAQPGQPAGADKIVVEGTDLFQVYDEATGQVALGPSVPAGIVELWPLTFIDDNTFIAPATTAVELAEVGPFIPGSLVGAPAPPNDLLRCTLSACVDLGTLPHNDTQIAMSPDYAGDHTFAAWAGNQVDVTRDGGSTFSSVMSLVPGQAPWGIAFTRSTGAGPELVVSSLAFDQQTARSTSWVTDIVLTSGGPVATTHDTTAYGTPFGMTATPDGRLWTSMMPGPTTSGSGPMCSADAGATWSADC